MTSDIINHKIAKYRTKLHYYSNLQQIGGAGKYKILFDNNTIYRDSNADQEALIDAFLAHEQTSAYVDNKIVTHKYSGGSVNICFRAGDGNIYIIPAGLNETRRCLMPNSTQISTLSSIKPYVALKPIIKDMNTVFSPKLVEQLAKITDITVKEDETLVDKGKTYYVIKATYTRYTILMLCLDLNLPAPPKLLMLYAHVTAYGHGSQMDNVKMNEIWKEWSTDPQIKKFLKAKGISDTNINNLFNDMPLTQ
jgi:hypothetical protein